MTTATAPNTPDAGAAPRPPDVPKGFELVDGQLRELNVSAKSAWVGGQLYLYLALFVRGGHPGWVFPADTSFRCFPGAKRTVRKPDAAFIALGRFTAEQYDTEGHISVCPDVVAEVISPNDLAGDVSEKRREWLQAGAKLVWVVDPDDRTVHVYPAAGGVALLRETDTLTGEPVLPGFAVPVADLFRLPTPPAAG